MAHSLELLAEKYSQLSEMPFQPRKTKPLSLYCIPGDVPRLSHNTYHPGSEEIVPAGTPLSDWEKIEDTKNKKFFNKPNSPIKKKTETTHPYTEIDEKETMSDADLNEFNDTHSDVAQELALDRMTGMGDSYEGNHDETDMSNPEERTEVHIAKEIKSLAEELLKMHGQKASDDGPLYPPYGGHNKK